MVDYCQTHQIGRHHSWAHDQRLNLLKVSLRGGEPLRNFYCLFHLEQHHVLAKAAQPKRLACMLTVNVFHAALPPTPASTEFSPYHVESVTESRAACLYSVVSSAPISSGPLPYTLIAVWRRPWHPKTFSEPHRSCASLFKNAKRTFN